MMRTLMVSTLTFGIGFWTFTDAGRAEELEAQEILQGAIRAAGGEQAFDRLKAPMMWMEQGTYYGMGEGIAYIGQYSSKWPNWYRQEIENAFTITVSGDAAWVTTPGGVEKLSGEQLEDQLKQARMAWAERLFPLTDDAYELTPIDGINVSGRPTVGIQATHADGGEIKLYFDQEHYRLVKSEAMVLSPEYGPDPVLSEAVYSNHRSFGGVVMPAKFTIHRDGKLFVEGETIDSKVYATLDPAHFQEPE